MCGRFALHAHPDIVSLQFGLGSLPIFEPHYNIAPTARILIVRGGGAGRARWGLVPGWAKTPSLTAKLHQARAETVAEKPAFREAYRRRRCLIPASGFYEWRSEGGTRQPYYVYPVEEPLLAFAGLWESWRGPDVALETCAIITTEANEKMRPIHDRMPVIVARADYAAWLGGAEVPLAPCPASAIALRRVSRAVNNARNDAAELIEPAPG